MTPFFHAAVLDTGRNLQRNTLKMLYQILLRPELISDNNSVGTHRITSPLKQPLALSSPFQHALHVRRWQQHPSSISYQRQPPV